MGDIGRFHFLGFIVSRVSYMNMWEVIQPAEEGKLEVSYRWFRTCKDAEVFCPTLSRMKIPPSLLLELRNAVHVITKAPLLGNKVILYSIDGYFLERDFPPGSAES